MADNLRSLLEGMGQTADEVAAFLEGQGCKGYRGTPYYCPVAKFLHQSGIAQPGVNSFIAYDRDSTSYEFLPDPVKNFVVSFDRGCYPQLDKEKTNV